MKYLIHILVVTFLTKLFVISRVPNFINIDRKKYFKKQYLAEKSKKIEIFFVFCFNITPKGKTNSYHIS